MELGAENLGSWSWPQVFLEWVWNILLSSLHLDEMFVFRPCRSEAGLYGVMYMSSSLSSSSWRTPPPPSGPDPLPPGQTPHPGRYPLPLGQTITALGLHAKSAYTCWRVSCCASCWSVVAAAVHDQTAPEQSSETHLHSGRDDRPGPGWPDNLGAGQIRRWSHRQVERNKTTWANQRSWWARSGVQTKQ